MTIESDLRAQGQNLQHEFALVRRMIKEGELEMATEELAYAKKTLAAYITRLKELDGAKVGLAGRIFRHPYHLDEEFMKVALAMDEDSKVVSQLLESTKKKAANQQLRAQNEANRQAARSRKAQEN